MSKKLTKEEFVKRSDNAHNGKYDYSLVEYKNTNSKVKIKCPVHGVFEQTPSIHMRKGGCPACKFDKLSKLYSLDTETFIKKAIIVHGDRYDYSLVNYKNAQTKVKIICPEHGVFEQLANSHLNGKGCFECKGTRKLTNFEFIEKCKLKHSTKYDYSLVEYVNRQTKIKIICPIHGVFEQTASDHLQGKGCRKCNGGVRWTTETFVKNARLIHGNKYDYSLVDYKNSQSKVKIVCPEHGEFEQIASVHLYSNGCPKCGNLQTGLKKRVGVEKFIKRASDLHSFKYNYDKVVFNTLHDEIVVTCPIHGDFKTQAQSHLNNGRCRKCSHDDRRYTLEEFINKSKIIHGAKYDYSFVDYKGSQLKVKIVCPKHGEFFQIPNKHLQGQGCSKCSNPVSKTENRIFEFVSKYLNCEQSNRKVMKGKELDIYIPELNIAIEYHGLYWHSDKFRDKNDHLNKLNLCEGKGIRLIQIFEDEWLHKKEIVKSRLLNLIGKTPNKIYARKCEIKEVDSTTAGKFLDENHIQGKLGSKIKLGLYFENELVSLMTFGGLRKNLGQTAKEGSYELLRFCNKLNTNVVGGASKLLSYFEKHFHPSEIISYADRRWSDGNLYEQLGFDFIHNSEPNYFYVIHNKRENRFKYRKSELVKQGFDPNKTEKEIMREQGFFRIYDCGTIKFIKKLKDY